jgi:hypothetical protein
VKPRRQFRRRTGGVAGALGALIAGSAAGLADDAWTTRKCEIYATAWSRALDLHGDAGLGGAFIESQEAFIASGCADGTKVCPTSDAEIRLADTLTILSMNEGMASTFVPFACPPVSSAPGAPERASPPAR